MADGPQLTREVLPPQKQSSGLGVMIVAATAMFFAVASSAFILRARMARSCCPATVSSPVVIEMEPVAAPPSDDCGAAVVKHHADGTETYYFEPCEELPAVVGDSDDAPMLEVRGSVPGGVVVDTVRP